MAEIKTLVNKFRALVAPLWVHASGQAVNWTIIATHDASKWEAAVSTLAVSAVVQVLRSVARWADLPAPKAPKA